eukprot:871431_1
MIVTVVVFCQFFSVLSLGVNVTFVRAFINKLEKDTKALLQSSLVMTSSVPVLVKRHVFGINNRFTNNIAFLDSRVLIYVAARNIVFYNIEEHSQRFVVGSSPSTENWVSDPEICSISLSPSTRYLAIAERGENPSFTVFDTQTLRKKKCVSLPSTIRSKEICSMSFSANNRYLAIQCGCPDWKLCIFEWEQGAMEHCITTSKDMTPVLQISYLHNNPDPSPNDPNLIAICHEESIQIHQQNGEDLTQQTIDMNGYEVDTKWACQCWLDDTLLCGNSAGDVIVIKEDKFHQLILSKKPQNDEEMYGITYIQRINNDIVAVGAQDCTVSFLHKSVENGLTTWDVICTINLLSSSALSSSSLSAASDNNNQNNKCQDKPVPFGMTVDPLSNQLLITTSNKQIYSLDISNIDPYSEDHNNKAITTSQPLGPFHFAGICGMDICIRKPWIVTCSEDKSICIWNYVTRKLEICKYFATKIRSVSFHPSGLHILAGFEDKLKLLNVLMDDIEPYKDFHIVRNCHECTFANGGHIFAAVNGDKIHIYNTYSGELISILRGHNQKIKSLYFSLDDTSLISAGAEGAVYEWSMFTFNRIQEMVNRQCPLNTAIITRDKKIYCTGNTPLLNEIMDSQLEKEIDIGTGLEITRLIISHLPQRMMFAATINGLIRSLKFPLSLSQGDQPDHLDYVGHLGCVERMVISQDDIYLFTCGAQDGCITIFEIRDKEGRLPSSSPSRAQRDVVASGNSANVDAQNGGFSTQILVTTSYLSERQQMFAELTNKVDELKLHNEYQLRLREMHYHETLKEREEKFNRELRQQKLKYEVLKDEQQDMEMEYEEKIKLAEDQHCKQVQELESFYQSQLMSEIETYRDLEVQMAEKQSNWEQITFTAHSQHETQLMNMKDRNEQMLNAEIQRKQKLNYEYEELRKEYNETKEQLLNDFDLEVQELKDKYDNILDEERENTLRLKGENGVMKKKFTSLQNEIDDQIEETAKMDSQETNFKKTIVSLKKEIEKLDDAMVSRDNVIGDKEKKIYKLKKKNQNLEKHKFVLDYKIKSLKKQIEPRQNKICAMKDNVKSLDKELEAKHKKNGELKLCIDELNQNIDQIQSHIEKKKEKYKKLRACVNKFAYDLSQIIELIQSPAQLKEYFENTMYSAAFKKFVDQNYQINNDVLEEYDQQRQHLVQSVNELKKTLNKQSKVNRKENYQIMMHNVDKMNQIQQLRKQLKTLQLSQISNTTASIHGNDQELNSKEEQQMLRNHIQQQNKQIQELTNQIQTLQNTANQ